MLSWEYIAARTVVEDLLSLAYTARCALKLTQLRLEQRGNDNSSYIPVKDM